MQIQFHATFCPKLPAKARSNGAATSARLRFESLTHSYNAKIQLNQLLEQRVAEYDTSTDPQLLQNPDFMTSQKLIDAILLRQFGTDFRQYRLMRKGNIPPGVEKRTTGETSNGAIAIALIDFLKYATQRSQNPLRPTNAEDSYFLLLYALHEVYTAAWLKTFHTQLADKRFKQDYSCETGFKLPSYTVAGYGDSDIIRSSITNKHLIFMGPHGSIQIMAQPTPQELVAMAESDPALRQEIDTQTPLVKTIDRLSLDWQKHFPPKKPGSGRGLSWEQTKALLLGNLKIKGQPVTMKDREFPSQWNDLHSLLYYIHFDFKRYINQGIWQPKVLFDLPGVDGKTVWES